MSSSAISELSHREIAHKYTEPDEPIAHAYAKFLNHLPPKNLLGQQKTALLYSLPTACCLLPAARRPPPTLTSTLVSSIYYVAPCVDTEYTIAYVGLGSNLGDRAGNLLMAVRGLMEASFIVNKLSAIYETEPVETQSGHNFLNMVAEIRVTSVSASQMMARLLRIEYLLGRREKGLNKPRTVDLDILFFGDQRLENEFLTIPHPRVHLRKFVLCPLNEIAPDFVHPGLGIEIAEILASVTDTSEVKRWNPNAARPSHSEAGA